MCQGASRSAMSSLCHCADGNITVATKQMVERRFNRSDGHSSRAAVGDASAADDLGQKSAPKYLTAESDQNKAQQADHEAAPNLQNEPTRKRAPTPRPQRRLMSMAAV